MRTNRSTGRCAPALALLTSWLLIGPARASDTRLVSEAVGLWARGGPPGNGASGSVSDRVTISPNGRFVAFNSDATDLVIGDENGTADVFVRDRKTSTTVRVSLAADGEAGGGGGGNAFIGANGRFVAFQSAATDLVTGDLNGTADIFVRDLKLGVTTRVSVDSAAAESNGSSFNPSLSASGRYVTFQSGGSNLVSGDLNGKIDIFVHDRKLGTTVRASISSAGVEADADCIGASISSNGRWVVFESGATNLVEGDSNAGIDVFRRDLKKNVTDRVSVSAAGEQGNSNSISARIAGGGRFVAFSSFASNLVTGDVEGSADVFVRDLKKGLVRRVSVDGTGLGGNSNSGQPSITSSGRFVTFESLATNFVESDLNGDMDVFRADLKTGLLDRVSVSATGEEADDASARSALSGNGRFVVFDSLATNLVTGDLNGERDVFLRDVK